MIVRIRTLKDNKVSFNECKKLWSPAATSSNIDKFKNQLGKNKNISSYNDLHNGALVIKKSFGIMFGILQRS